MAEDGSGGLVYRKRVEGRAHVFAAQYVGQRWRAPQRVDVGQAFDSSWPRIGAGNGGRLVVTWVQEFGVKSDRMFSASLDPGASSLSGARGDRLQRRRGDGDISVAGDEPRRCGLSRLPDRDRGRLRWAAARLRPRRDARGPLQRIGLVGARRARQPQPVVSGRARRPPRTRRRSASTRTGTGSSPSRSPTTSSSTGSGHAGCSGRRSACR